MKSDDANGKRRQVTTTKKEEKDRERERGEGMKEKIRDEKFFVYTIGDDENKRCCVC